jgi:hypothetical protein
MSRRLTDEQRRAGEAREREQDKEREARQSRRRPSAVSWDVSDKQSDSERHEIEHGPHMNFDELGFPLKYGDRGEDR